MVRPTSIGNAIAFGLLATSTQASRIRIRQPQATTAVVQGGVATTSSAASETTQDVPEALLSIANSLISENYPSQTIVDIGTLSFPTTVVIGTHTYTVSPDATSTPSSTSKSQQDASNTQQTHKPEETNAKSTSKPESNKADKHLAIILGVVIGAVVLLFVGVVFFCLHRRKRDNGSFFLRRSTPSMRSTGSWRPGSQRPDTFGNTTYVSAAGAPSNMHQQKYPQMAVIERGHTPPVDAHPAYLHHESSRSTSEENPFYTPEERSSSALNSHELHGEAIRETDHADLANRRSSTSLRDSRPPTPFSPLMMTQNSGPAARPQIHTNPFASAEDDEQDDLVSPIVPPTRNPERRYSPMVHYPSWDEVSAFSFNGSSERDSRVSRVEDGGDGWRADRERRQGRHELA